MTLGEMVAFTRRSIRAGATISNSATCAPSICGRPAIKGLSRGMRTKAALLLALCRGAELLILDEPTSALDPAMAEDMLQALVSMLRPKIDRLLFVASTAEVEQIADHVAIIDRGQLSSPARSMICARGISASSWSSKATRLISTCMRRACIASGSRAAW